MVFAIPRGGKTYVGTTDTFYDKDAAVPQMTTEDRTYIINAINYMFPSVKITEKRHRIKLGWCTSVNLRRR